MKLSCSAAYDPRTFVLALQDQPAGFFPLDSPVFEQNDANEFFSLLLDRLGEAFPGEAITAIAASSAEAEATAAAVSKPSDVFTATFGGELVHQLIGKQCCHTKTRCEPFMCVGLEVKGKANVHQSLSAFVESELLSGDNAYHCDECNA